MTTTKPGSTKKTTEPPVTAALVATTLAPAPSGTPDPCSLLDTNAFNNSGLQFQVVAGEPGLAPNGSATTDPTCLWHSTGDAGYVLLRVRSDGSAGHDREMAREPRSENKVAGIGDEAFTHTNTEVFSAKVGTRALSIQVSGAVDNTKTATNLGKIALDVLSKK